MHRLIVILGLLIPAFIKAQAPYGNEWIDYSQAHYKFQLAQDGIYRIPYNTIAAAIPGINSIDPNNITIFTRGKKIPIYVSWSSNPSSADFIEFYGKKLGGEIDAKLYSKSENQLNPNYSVFGDTATYYLSLRTAPNPRLVNTTNDLSSLPPKENWFYHTTLTSFNSSYSGGRRSYISTYEFVISPGYDNGEGYGNAVYLTASSNAISTPFINTGAGVLSSIKTRIIAFNAGPHRLQFSLNSNLIKDTLFDGSFCRTFSLDVPTTQLISNNNFTITPLFNRYHGYMTGFIEIVYPRDFNFGGQNNFYFQVLGNSSKQYIEINNFSFSSGNPILYDLTSGLRISGNIPTSGNPLKLALPAANGQRELYLFNENQFLTINSISARTFINYTSSFNQGNYIMIYHPKLTNDGLGNNRIAEYKAYRESAAGGSKQVVNVNINDLYDQFSFGQNKNPLAIKKFLQFAYSSWSIKPQHVFLIGKGRPNEETRNPAVTNAILIPTMGVSPALSDIALSSTDTANLSLLPIGRLAVETGDDINNYLNKVKAYEIDKNKIGDPNQTINIQEPKKWAIHLGGGSDQSQQNAYAGSLKFYESQFRGNSIGGTVYGLYKNNSSIQQDITSDRLKKLINRGVSQITFFGHSAATIFDVGIDEPENFTNTGKYPFFLANGCNSGYIFSGSKGYSERFVLLPNKGAIGFLATANFSYDNALIEYSRSFYSNLTNGNYGKTYGQIALGSGNDIIGSYPVNTLQSELTTAQEFILHGDPAIEAPYYGLPDYVIEPQQVSFIPSIVNASNSSFKLRLIVLNLGKAINDTLQIEITRHVSNRNFVYKQTVKAPFYADTIDIQIPTLEEEIGTGINNFDIKIESENKITEISETNNNLLNAISTQIVSDDIFPIYPYEFSIVNKKDIELKASTSNVFAPIRNYVFEIDTTEKFNSSLKTSATIASSGGVLRWKPNLDLLDSTVYYWRVSYQATGNWYGSSFIYIQNEFPGWNQSHYFQYKKNEQANLLIDSVDRSFKFVDNIKTINIKTRGAMTVNWGYGEIEWNLNNARQQAFRENNYITSGINFIWLDKSTGLPYFSIDSLYNGAKYGYYGSIAINYGANPDVRMGFVFPDTGMTPANHPTRPNQPWSEVIHDFLNQIPIGDYVFAYTLKRTNYAGWSNQLKLDFLSLGGTKVTDLINNATKAPYIFGCKKGDISFTPIQKVGTSFNNITDTSFGITGSWYSGYFTSPPIGPATSWNSFHWKYHTKDLVNSDKQSIDILGVNANNQDVFLKTVYQNDTNIQFINAVQYPYLKLRFNTTDIANQTPAQLDYWRILCKPAPEMALNPNRFFEFKDTFQEGEPVEMRIALENVGESNFDSVQVKTDYQINNVHSIVLTKTDSLRAEKFNILKLTAPYNASIGDNVLSIDANPFGPNFQAEQFHFNNLLQRKYYVTRDVINPLLDVTFDGVRIMNKEIVSSKPHIVISLKDENRFQALNDTAVLSLKIKTPDNSILPIYHNDPRLKFNPATIGSSRNMATMEFDPSFDVDGEYELQVSNRDIAGNRSGNKKSFDYNIAFNIVNKQTITRLLNYPNPFTTRTQFIFSLTGNKIPEYIKIQILTISGKIVREITKEELGPLRIGMNKTQFWWDGTDTYGDALANGVYLYRVVIRDQGKDVEQRQIFTSEKVTNDLIEKAFNSGYGKMVLVR